MASMMVRNQLIVALALAFQARLALGFAERGSEAGRCEFENEPIGVGSFWDPTCHMGMIGCNADGRNLECRLCGAGDFVNVTCPPSTCKFPNEPFVSYYWDNECEMGKLGCWADGIHAQCRFCGNYPYTSIPCPEGAAPPNGAACHFDVEPDIPHYWEPGCEMGVHGCNADGRQVKCRYCGKGIFSDIPCSASQVCEFSLDPTVPFYWDSQCKPGLLGCNADGLHPECRFCAKRPFEDVPCPEPVAPPEGVCTWPLHGEPLVPYYWDEDCDMGKLGCWADGIHAQCRFCGTGVFSTIPCPNTTTTTTPDTAGQRLTQGAVGTIEEKVTVARASAANAEGMEHDIYAGENSKGEEGEFVTVLAFRSPLALTWTMLFSLPAVMG